MTARSARRKVEDALTDGEFNVLTLLYAVWSGWDFERSPAQERADLRRTARALRTAMDCLRPDNDPGDVLPSERGIGLQVVSRFGAIEGFEERRRRFIDAAADLITCVEEIEAEIPQRRYRRFAPILAARSVVKALRARGIAVTSYVGGVAARELVRVARAAGDPTLTPAAAAQYVKRVLSVR